MTYDITVCLEAPTLAAAMLAAEILDDPDLQGAEVVSYHVALRPSVAFDLIQGAAEPDREVHALDGIHSVLQGDQWRVACVCGWKSDRWTNAPARAIRDHARRTTEV